MTIPTIAELRGNTILELFNNGYNAVKNGKQDKLVAGDNIIIDGNVISAIEGGTPALENYYTKQETDSLLGSKADTTDVYSKSDVDTLLTDYYDKDTTDSMLEAIANEIPDMTQYYDKTETYSKAEVNALIGSGEVEVINVTLSSGAGGTPVFTTELKPGDLVAIELRSSTNVVIDSTVCSFVNNNISDLYVKRNTSSSTDATNYSETNDIVGIVYDSGDNIYMIRAIRETITVTNGAISKATTTFNASISIANSRVTVYRKKEE